jgi:hypothetical protein
MDDLDNTLDKEMILKKIREEVAERLKNYQKTMSYMAADAPLGVLCLPKEIENALINHGCLRVYDLFDRDFTEIKGLGVSRIKRLTAALDQFFAMF